MSTAREIITSQIQTLAGLYGTLEDPAYKELVKAFNGVDKTENKIVLVDNDLLVSKVFLKTITEHAFISITHDELTLVKHSMFANGDILIFISSPEINVLKTSYELASKRTLSKFALHSGKRVTELGNELGLIEIGTNSESQTKAQQVFSIISVLEYALADSAQYMQTPVYKRLVAEQQFKPEVQAPRSSLIQNFQAEQVIPSSTPDEPNFVVPSGDELASMIAAASAQIGKPTQQATQNHNEYLSDAPDDLADRSFS